MHGPELPALEALLRRSIDGLKERCFSRRSERLLKVFDWAEDDGYVVGFHDLRVSGWNHRLRQIEHIRLHRLSVRQPCVQREYDAFDVVSQPVRPEKAAAIVGCETPNLEDALRHLLVAPVGIRQGGL